LSLKDLVCLCAGPLDDEAWEEFVSRVGRPISLTIMWTASQWGERSRSVVEDLVHDTYIKLWKDSCRLLRDFAIQHPDEAILRYIKKTAANTTHDYFRKHGAARYRMIDNYDATIDIDLNFTVLLKEINEHLKHCLAEPDRERDRMIFWLYFRQGMSCKEIASLRIIGLSAKGVGSVIERLKHCLRERILRLPADSEDDKE